MLRSLPEVLLTYKYRLKGKRAERALGRHASAVNKVWNFCVSVQKEACRRYRHGRTIRWPTNFDLNKLTKGTSKDLRLNSQTIQATCEQFTTNRDQQCRKWPRFRHSSGSKRSLGWIPFKSQSRQLIGKNTVSYFGQTFRFFGTKRRPLPAIVKGGAFVEDAQGKWYVCFHVEVADQNRTGTGSIGIDLGLKHLATLSDGEKIENPRSFRLYENKLAVAQRAGNRKRVKAIHAKIRNTRKDHQHKTTTRLVRQYDLIAVGNVSSSKLAKTRMAKSVLDAGWSTFRNMLAYKASRHRATFVTVDEKFSTQTCSSCGNCSSARRPKGIAGLGIRVWKCDCGAVHDRDVNAAKNILRLGLSAQPRVDESQLQYG